MIDQKIDEQTDSSIDRESYGALLLLVAGATACENTFQSFIALLLNATPKTSNYKIFFFQTINQYKVKAPLINKSSFVLQLNPSQVLLTTC